jgi:hypothetical protein
MKTNSLVLGAVAGMLMPGALAEAPKRMAMRDAVTHDQIVEADRKAKEDAPPPVFKPAEGEDPSVTNRPQGLLSQSEIFCFLGKASLVPKRAVLHVPKELAGRLGMKDGVSFVSWREFHGINRAWIRTVQVSRAQAEGRQPLDEELLKSFAKEPRLVVATYQEGPISVTPLRVPPPQTEVAPGQAAAAVTNQPVAKP